MPATDRSAIHTCDSPMSKRISTSCGSSLPPGYQAATNGHDAVVQHLLAAGASPNAQGGLALMDASACGHVAVVARVVSARELEIDHANWAGPGLRRGMIARGLGLR